MYILRHITGPTWQKVQKRKQITLSKRKNMWRGVFLKAKKVVEMKIRIERPAGGCPMCRGGKKPVYLAFSPPNFSTAYHSQLLLTFILSYTMLKAFRNPMQNKISPDDFFKKIDNVDLSNKTAREALDPLHMADRSSTVPVLLPSKARLKNPDAKPPSVPTSMKEPLNPSRLTEELCQMIRELYVVENLDLPEVYKTLNISRASIFQWTKNNHLGFRDFLRELRDDKVVAIARENMISLLQSPNEKIRSSNTQFILETKGGFSKNMSVGIGFRDFKSEEEVEDILASLKNKNGVIDVESLTIRESFDRFIEERDEERELADKVQAELDAHEETFKDDPFAPPPSPKKRGRPRKTYGKS